MKVNAIYSELLVGVIDKLNELNVKREDIINIFQNNAGQYIAIFYS